MSNTILCAVDISNKYRDKGVLQKAAQLAALDGSQLDVITVIPDFGLSIVGGYFDKKHQKHAFEHAKSELKDMVQSALEEDVAAKVRHLVATGTAYEEILAAAAANKASLIVIGAHKPDFKDYLLGPNAARVVRHASASVYVVR